MTLARRVQAVEQRRGGRRKEPREMSYAELWHCILDGVRNIPDGELHAALALRREVESGARVPHDWPGQMLRLIGPHIPELAEAAKESR